MKLHEFNQHPMLVSESNYDNLKPLTLMAQSILKNVSYSLEKGNTNKVVPSFNDDLLKVLRKYGDVYDSLCSYIEQYVPIYLANGATGNFKGAYTHSPTQENPYIDDITIYVPTIIEPKDVYTSSDLRNPKIENTLVHELRHVMQRRQFGKYYHAVADRGDNYRTDPIEIDAAFLHHLHDETATDLRGFVYGVMDRFSKYKDLTAKQYEHYKRKAAAYYYANVSPESSGKSTPQERLDKQRKEKWDAMISQVTNADIEPLHDLRNVGSKKSGKFLINGNAFRSVVLSLMNGKEVTGVNLGLAVAFLGLMKKINPDLPARQIAGKLNLNLDQIADDLQNADLGGFDNKLFVNAVKSLKSEKKDK